MTAGQRKAVKAMQKKTWSPEARAKRAATLAAKRAAREAIAPNVQDALAYLLKAEQAIIKTAAAGGKRIGPVETLTLLALNSLRGEI